MSKIQSTLNRQFERKQSSFAFHRFYREDLSKFQLVCLTAPEYGIQLRQSTDSTGDSRIVKIMDVSLLNFPRYRWGNLRGRRVRSIDADAFDAWSSTSVPIPMISLDRRSPIINRLVSQPCCNDLLAVFAIATRSLKWMILDTRSLLHQLAVVEKINVDLRYFSHSTSDNIK